MILFQTPDCSFIDVIPLEYVEIVNYLQSNTFPKDYSVKQEQRLAFKAGPYTIIANTLYKQGKDDVLRKCVTSYEIPQILKDCYDNPVNAYRNPQYVLKMIHVRSQSCILTIWFILKWSSPLKKH